MQTNNTEPRSAWAARIKNLQSLEGYNVDPEASFNRIMARVNTGTSPRKSRSRWLMAAVAIAVLGIALLRVVRKEANVAEGIVHIPLQKAPFPVKQEPPLQQGISTSDTGSSVAHSHGEQPKEIRILNIAPANKPVIQVPDRVAVAVMSPEPETPNDTASLAMHEPLPVMHANQLRSEAGAKEATHLLKNPFYKMMQGPRPQQAAAPMLSDRNMLQTKTTDN